MELTELTQVIKQNGIAFTISCVVIYFAIKFGNLWFEERRLKLERENALILNTERIVNWATLRSNPFFVNMNHWIYFKIPHTQFGDPGRDLMVKDMLNILYVEFRDKLISLVEDETHNNLTTVEFQTVMVKILSKGMHDFINKSRKEQIPLPLINLFSKYHEPNIQYIKVAIEGICNSGYHQNNAEKVVGILNIYSASFEITLSHGEKALKNLNGQLTGKTYKGLIAG
jgi:hypothetical protein